MGRPDAKLIKRKVASLNAFTLNGKYRHFCLIAATVSVDMLCVQEARVDRRQRRSFRATAAEYNYEVQFGMSQRDLNGPCGDGLVNMFRKGLAQVVGNVIVRDIKWAASLRSAMNGGDSDHRQEGPECLPGRSRPICASCAWQRLGPWSTDFLVRPLGICWPTPPAIGRSTLAATGGDRARLLQTRRLLAIRVRVADPSCLPHPQSATAT